MSERNRCAAENCKAYPLRGEDHCFHHSTDPKIVVRRHEARKLGGRNRRAAIRLPVPKITSPEQVKEVLGEAIATLSTKRCDLERIKLLQSLCSTFLKAYQAIETDKKIQELEAKLSEQ